MEAPNTGRVGGEIWGFFFGILTELTVFGRTFGIKNGNLPTS